MEDFRLFLLLLLRNEKMCFLICIFFWSFLMGLFVVLEKGDGKEEDFWGGLLDIFFIISAVVA